MMSSWGIDIMAKAPRGYQGSPDVTLERTSGVIAPRPELRGRRKLRLPFRDGSLSEVQHDTPDPYKDLDPGPLTIVRVYRRGRYLSSQISILVARYVRIRGDLLSLFQPEEPKEKAADQCQSESWRTRKSYAKRCADYLSNARNQLESRRTNLAVCSNALSLAERQLVQLYPSETLQVRFEIVRQLLLDRADKSNRVGRELQLLAKHQTSNDIARRTRLQEGLITAYQVDEQELLEDDLQVTRLRRLLMYMSLSWGVLMLVMPYVTVGVLQNREIAGWPVYDFDGNEWLTQIVAALGISVIGAVGGVISGMFGVRDARATLGDFRTSLLRLSLKPVAGAIAALVVYLFLSWQVISGVKVTSGGVYVLAAFLAGFSERYFLRILRTEELQGQGTKTMAGESEPNGQVATIPQRTPRAPVSSRRRPTASERSVRPDEDESRRLVRHELVEPPPV
jgi:hypothetical protein